MDSVISNAIDPHLKKGTGETSVFSQVMEAIEKNNRLLADRYYCLWAILALMIQRKTHLLVQSHAPRKQMLPM